MKPLGEKHELYQPQGGRTASTTNRRPQNARGENIQEPRHQILTRQNGNKNAGGVKGKVKQEEKKVEEKWIRRLSAGVDIKKEISRVGIAGKDNPRETEICRLKKREFPGRLIRDKTRKEARQVQIPRIVTAEWRTHRVSREIESANGGCADSTTERSVGSKTESGGPKERQKRSRLSVGDCKGASGEKKSRA